MKIKKNVFLLFLSFCFSFVVLLIATSCSGLDGSPTLNGLSLSIDGSEQRTDETYVNLTYGDTTCLKNYTIKAVYQPPTRRLLLL